MGYIQKLILAGATLGVLSSPAHADTMVGRVIAAEGPNSVERDGPTALLTEGSYVFKDDVIYTGSDASLQIEWFDSHETILGSNSMIFVREILQDELYRNSEEYRLTGNIPAGAPQP
jgi:hypothetical protein